MTQRARVLDVLRHAGRAGVVSTDLLEPEVVDRGRPVLRLAARVYDLRGEGHAIVTLRDAGGLGRYILLREAHRDRP